MLQFPCPSCGKKLKAPEASAGRQLACPACKGHILVPMAESASGSIDDEVTAWLEGAPQSMDAAAAKPPDETGRDKDTYRLSHPPPSASESDARCAVEGLSDEPPMLDVNLAPARNRRRSKDNELTPTYDRSHIKAATGNLGKLLSTAGLSALLVGLAWFIWSSASPDYHYHVDEDSVPPTLVVHRGMGEASVVDKLTLGVAESHSVVGPREVVAGSQTSQGSHGDWEVAFDRHMWTGRVRVNVKRNGKQAPPCNLEVARQEECRREIVALLQTGTYRVKFEQMVANASGSFPPAAPILRTKLIFLINAKETRGRGGWLELAIDNPPVQGRLESNDCDVQWDLHKSEYSAAHYGVTLQPELPSADLLGNIEKQAALHPDVNYRLEVPNGGAGIKAIVVDRITGKTIAQLPVGNGLFDPKIRREINWTEWDPTVHAIAVQYQGKDVAPIAEQAEHSENPLVSSLQERR